MEPLFLPDPVCDNTSLVRSGCLAHTSHQSVTTSLLLVIAAFGPFVVIALRRLWLAFIHRFRNVVVNPTM